MVVTTIPVFTSHEVVLPVAWSRNVARRVITLGKKPAIAKIRYAIEDRGVYRFGFKTSEFDPLLGFTINVNGIDKAVHIPVNPTDWIEIEITDVIAGGNNIFDGIIWRSLLNLVVSYYVVFSVILVCEDVEEIPYEVKPIQQVAPLGAIDVTALVNMFWLMYNMFTLYVVLQLITPLISILTTFIKTMEKEMK